MKGVDGLAVVVVGVSAYVPGGIVIVCGTCLDNCRNLDKFPASYAETHLAYYSAFSQAIQPGTRIIIKINSAFSQH